jgi:hypothetical protein
MVPVSWAGLGTATHDILCNHQRTLIYSRGKTAFSGLCSPRFADTALSPLFEGVIRLFGDFACKDHALSKYSASRRRMHPDFRGEAAQHDLAVLDRTQLFGDPP